MQKRDPRIPLLSVMGDISVFGDLPVDAGHRLETGPVKGRFRGVQRIRDIVLLAESGAQIVLAGAETESHVHAAVDILKQQYPAAVAGESG